MKQDNFTKILTVRLTEAQEKQLRAKAEYEEVSMTEIVRDLLVNYLALADTPV